MLSQVAWPQRVYARRVYERRFSAVPSPHELRWARQFTDLELRLQQDHLTSLAGVAEQVALTSDVVNHATVLDNAGTERKRETILALGVPSLLERVPKLFQIEAHASWEWGRYKATRTRKGSRMDVEGARLSGRRRQALIPTSARIGRAGLVPGAEGGDLHAHDLLKREHELGTLRLRGGRKWRLPGSCRRHDPSARCDSSS